MITLPDHEIRVVYGNYIGRLADAVERADKDAICDLLARAASFIEILSKTSNFELNEPRAAEEADNFSLAVIDGSFTNVSVVELREKLSTIFG